MSKRIVIVGGRGKMGSLFAEAFRGKDLDVVQVDHKTSLTPVEAVKTADVVIITVPIRYTEETIKNVAPHIPEHALLTDFTSVKIRPVEAMLKYSRSDIIGGHPVFGPTVQLKGQTFVICPVRGNAHVEWFTMLLESLGLKVILMSPEEHDQEMAIVQCLTHFSGIALSHTLHALDVDLEKTRDFASPVYILRLYGAVRMFAQDPELYADIQMMNPYSREVALAFAKSVNHLASLVVSQDQKAFEKEFTIVQEYLGSLPQEATTMTNKMLEKK